MTESAATRAFGRFQLIRMLGQGGFGEVWLAYDPQMEAQIALKVLHQGLMSDGHFVKSVQREASLTQKIDHPNVVKIHEIGETAGRMYIAMAYIDGPTLAETIETGRRWSIDQVIMLVSQVASALDATHAQGVVHRDVKPANILIDAEGHAHLVDFGLAHAAMSSIGASANSVGMGTAAYMSPEQAGGQAGDRRADIYSLGVIAYELLTGQLPFRADTLMGYMMAHQNESPPYPSKFNPGISRNLQDVILKALEKDPNNRYKAAGAFSAALQKAATRKFRKARTRPPSKVGRVLRWAMVLLLLLGLPIGAFASGLVPLPPSIRERVAPIPPTATEDVPQATAAAPDTATSTPTEAPSATPTPEDTATPEPKPEDPTPTMTTTPTATATATATPTDTPTPTATPEPEAPLDAEGEIPSAYALQVIDGSTESGKGKLVVQIMYGDGRPLTNHMVRVYSQKQDISGNWVMDTRLAERRTDNAGLVEFSLQPGEFIVRTDYPGYNWGNSIDTQGLHSVPLEVGRVTQLRLSLGHLVVGFRRGDGSAISNQLVRIYRQKLDVGGQWVVDGSPIREGRTDNSGSVGFTMVPGRYIIRSDFAGYNWGNAYDVKGLVGFAVPPGQVSPMIYDLGRLVVGLTGSDGSALTNKLVRVYLQRLDLNGNPVVGSEAGSGRTDNAGMLNFNLTHGLYAVRIDDNYVFNIPLESGKITQYDGQTATVVDP